MTRPAAGLFVRLDRSGHVDLDELRPRLEERPLGSVYVDATRSGPVPALRTLATLRPWVRPSGALEVTLALRPGHAVALEPRALAAAGVNRLAWTAPPRPLIPLGLRQAVDLRAGPRALATAAWLAAQGVGHLAVTAADAREADRLARAIGRLGFHRYDLWNLARPGQVCRHLRDARRGGELLAAGPGAAGRIRVRDRWLVRRRGRWRPADPLAVAVERVIDRLQLREGGDLAAIARDHGIELPALIDRAALERLRALGLLIGTGLRVRVAEPARAQTDPILVDLLAPALTVLAAPAGSLR